LEYHFRFPWGDGTIYLCGFGDLFVLISVFFKELPDVLLDLASVVPLLMLLPVFIEFVQQGFDMMRGV